MKIGKIIYFVLLGGALVANGQLNQSLTPPLTNKLVQKIIPVLRVQVAQTQTALGQLNQRLSQINQYTELIEDIKSGKIDPLTWLKSKSNFVMVPAAATYKPKLSSWTSSFLNEPTAVFSFGVEAPEQIKKAARSGEEMVKLMYSSSGLDFSNIPGGKKISDLAEKTKEYYSSKGFSDPYSKIFFDLMFHSPDQTVSVMFYYVNFYGVQETGEIMADGPMLMLWANSQVGNEAPETTEKQKIQGQDVETAMQRTGMTQEEYDAYLGSLVLARNDAMNPAALEITVDFSQLPVEEVKTVKEMQHFMELRKANVWVYNRFAHILEPLLVALGY